MQFYMIICSVVHLCTISCCLHVPHPAPSRLLPQINLRVLSQIAKWTHVLDYGFHAFARKYRAQVCVMNGFDNNHSN